MPLEQKPLPLTVSDAPASAVFFNIDALGVVGREVQLFQDGVLNESELYTLAKAFAVMFSEFGRDANWYVKDYLNRV